MNSKEKLDFFFDRHQDHAFSIFVIAAQCFQCRRISVSSTMGREGLFYKPFFGFSTSEGDHCSGRICVVAGWFRCLHAVQFKLYYRGTTQLQSTFWSLRC
uniref:Uncharacterized protein n=1 Tax=Physcomitrium patens TaxID=3218 RepID=A0A2K1J8W9_PHYPA|nr:hypothetical protein PHYPA_021067 [Physcomitrium patens]